MKNPVVNVRVACLAAVLLTLYPILVTKGYKLHFNGLPCLKPTILLCERYTLSTVVIKLFIGCQYPFTQARYLNQVKEQFLISPSSATGHHKLPV